MRALAIAILLLGTAPLTRIASAAPFDFLTFGAEVPQGPQDTPSLWRGHFSGGRNVDPTAQQIALDWKDEVAFFPDDRSCRHWIRDLRAQYGTYQGYTGCLRIR